MITRKSTCLFFLAVSFGVECTTPPHFRLEKSLELLRRNVQNPFSLRKIHVFNNNINQISVRGGGIQNEEVSPLHDEKKTTEYVKVSRSNPLEHVIHAKREEMARLESHYLMSEIYREGSDERERVEARPPKELLYQIAIKIGAIQRSPDYLLKIRSASVEEAGLACFAIGILAGVSDLFEKRYGRMSTLFEENDGSKNKQTKQIKNAMEEIVKDRRFEQILECMLCGLDFERRMKQKEENEIKEDIEEIEGSPDLNDSSYDSVAELVDSFDIKKGLSIRDISQAAWGMAILGVHEHVDKIAGEAPQDIFLALSLRCKDLLQSKYQKIKFLLENESEQDNSVQLKTEIDTLARDTARSMWAFSCVKACTSVRSDQLLQTCCEILNCNLVAFERLSESVNNEKKEKISSSVQHICLYNALNPQELVNVIWALAVHNGGETGTFENEVNVDYDVETLSVITKKMKEVLEKNIEIIFSHEKSSGVPNSTSVKGGLKSDNEQALEINSKSTDQSDTVQYSEMATSVVENFMEDNQSLDGKGIDLNSTLRENDLCINASQEKKMSLDKNEDVKPSIQNDPSEVLEVVDAASLITGESNVKHEIMEVDSSENGDKKHSTNDVLVLNDEGDVTTGKKANSHNELGLSSEPYEPDHKLEEFPTFSLKDMCSIVWALTVLHSRMSLLTTPQMRDFVNSYREIMNLAVTIIANSSKESILDDLDDTTTEAGKFHELFEMVNGVDISNLCWSISKCFFSDHFNQTIGDPMNDRIASIFIDAMELFLKRLTSNCKDDSQESNQSGFNGRMQSFFEPPVLSRLMLSFSYIFPGTTTGIASSGIRNEKRHKIIDLMNALMSVGINQAIKNSSCYRAEDLARFVLAYGEAFPFRILKNSSDTHDINVALGGLQTTIESALLQWETGRLSSRTDISWVWHVPMFERSSLNLPLDAFESSDSSVDDDSGEIENVQSEDGSSCRKGVLPNMKTLPLDPSTLCKVAFVYTRMINEPLGSPHSSSGAEELVRIAARIFTYCTDSFLNQFHPRDVARLCYAYSKTIDSYPAIVDDSNYVYSIENHDVLTRSFKKRVVHFLNSFSRIRYNHICGESSNSVNALESVGGEDLANLLWSLGELGVKAGVYKNTKEKKFLQTRLNVPRPMLDKDELNALCTASILDMLHGVITLDDVQSDKILIRNILLDIMHNKMLMFSSDQLCRTTMNVVKLRSVLKKKISNDLSSSGAKSDPGIIIDASEYDRGNETQDSSDVVGMKENCTESGLLTLCDNIIIALANTTIQNITQFRPSQLRKILRALVFSSFQCDDLVNCIESEVRKRITITSEQRGKSIRTIIQDATDVLNETMIIPLIGKNECEVLREKMETTISSMRDAAELIQVGDDTDIKCRSVESGDAFELGKCLELLNAYHRLEFQSGTRKGRFTGGKEKNIGNRVLSRLFRF